MTQRRNIAFLGEPIALQTIDDPSNTIADSGLAEIHHHSKFETEKSKIGECLRLEDRVVHRCRLALDDDQTVHEQVQAKIRCDGSAPLRRNPAMLRWIRNAMASRLCAFALKTLRWCDDSTMRWIREIHLNPRSSASKEDPRGSVANTGSTPPPISVSTHASRKLRPSGRRAHAFGPPYLDPSPPASTNPANDRLCTLKSSTAIDF